MTTSRARTAVFIFPEVLRPQKANFSGRFEKLSERYAGHIFALCGTKETGLELGRFRLWSERAARKPWQRVVRKTRASVIAPLLKLMRGTKPDVVIAYDPLMSGLGGAVLKALYGTRLIVELNGDDLNLDLWRGDVAGRARRALAMATVRAADAVKVLNSHQEAFVRQRFPGKPVFRFMNYTATDYFGTLDTYRGDYILSVGHPWELKGMDLLVRAFNEVKPRHPRITLRIMGYFTKEEIWKHRELFANGNGIEILRPGWIEDVAAQMRGCAAYVNASRREAGGRAVFEAMACGKPVIMSRTNAGLDYIRHDETGLLFAVGSWSELAERLDFILSNPAAASRLGEEGRQRLNEEYSGEQYIQRFHEMVDVVLGARPTVVPTD